MRLLILLATLALPTLGALSLVAVPAGATMQQQSSASDGTLYMVDSSSDSLYTLNTSDGTATLVGSTGTSTADGLAFASDGTLYMVDSSSDSLYTLNTSDGTSTLVGSTGTSDSTGLAFASDGALYMVDSSSDSLYTVNTSDGTATLVGSTGTPSPTGLAFASDGTLYMVDSASDSLYTVNTSVGTATRVGGLGVSDSAGLAFASDGTLYMVDSFSDSLYTLNTSDGTSTLVGSTGTSSPTGLAFRSPTFGFDSDTAERNLPNNTPEGGTVGMPVAVDKEGTGDVSYTLGGTDISSFVIDSSTGQITLASGVTIGSDGTTYEVTVTATGAGNASDTVTVTITVTGANVAPSFEEETVTRSIVENSPGGTNVGAPVTATDGNDDALAYVLGGTDAGSYDIGITTGQITLASGATLDYETDNSDTVTVTASDGYGGMGTVTVVITITDEQIAGEVDAPHSIQVNRSVDNSSITISWSAPEGGIDAYTVQRQHLVIQGGSAFFANITTVGWLAGDTLTYEDSGILPGRTYEYRVAAIKGEVVGEYSEWYRTTPYETIFGESPKNLRISADTMKDDRREVWLSWDAVDGADDYEVGKIVGDPATGQENRQDGIVVTDPTYFHTARSRSEFRVRGRNQDDAQCGSGADDRCYTGWTAWITVGYVPPAWQESLATPVPVGTTTAEMRTALEGALAAALDPTGSPFDPGDILNGLSLVIGFAVAAVCFAGASRVGMAPLGAGMGSAFGVLWLWLCIRLLGVPAAWGIIALVIVVVGGGVSLALAIRR